MAVTITEKVTSGNTVLNSTAPTTTKIYNVWGTTDEATVISQVEETCQPRIVVFYDQA